MTVRQKPPVDFDDSPELGEGFFANARPALENPELARVLDEAKSFFAAE
jgi:hypothetical protein